MIYARRALQRRLDEIRPILGAKASKALANRVNRPGRDRIAAMWELVILHALAKLGTLTLEAPLASGRRPDIAFSNGALAFTADITSVSDDGLDAENPYVELSQEIEAAKNRLGLPIGGVDLRINSRDEQSKRGRRRVLTLPHRKRIRDLVRTVVEPALREQIEAGNTVLALDIDTEDASFRLTIDPARGHYSSGGYAAYDTPTIRDGNPLYKAMKAKADQLRQATGIKGIIVGDAGTRTLADRGFSPDGLSAGDIVRELFRQYSSIDFVFLLSVRSENHAAWMGIPASRNNHAEFYVRDGFDRDVELADVFRVAVQNLPRPLMSPGNAALRALETGYAIGYHGGYGRVGVSKARIGARELVEILSGQRSIMDDGAKYPDKRVRPRNGVNEVEIVFARALAEGRLPTAISVTKGGKDDSDDWIDFEFGDPDPAISPLT